MTTLLLAFKSLRSRRFTTVLTLFAIALPVMLLVGVDRLRESAHAGFAGTLSRTDLIVGARGGELPLLLSSIFHLGAPTNNITWESYQHFAHHPAVGWTIPISIGDSFHGKSVVATDENFYEHYSYRGDGSIGFAEGRQPAGLFDVAVGAAAAHDLHLAVGQQLVLAHGVEQRSILNHAATPFTVVGILRQTGTPVDQSLFITLLGEEAMHFGWEGGTPPAIGEAVPKLDPSKLQVKQITSFLLGARSRVSTLYLQREIDTYKGEPLTAAIPAYALQQLWTLLDAADLALSLLSGAVLIVGLLAMLAALYTALNERRGEIALFRAVGMHARQVFALFICEAVLVAAAGTALGIAATYAVLLPLRGWLERQYGLPVALGGISVRVEQYAIATVVSAAILGAIPAWRAYRTSLLDVLSGG